MVFIQKPDEAWVYLNFRWVFGRSWCTTVAFPSPCIPFTALFVCCVHFFLGSLLPQFSVIGVTSNLVVPVASSTPVPWMSQALVYHYYELLSSVPCSLTLLNFSFSCDVLERSVQLSTCTFVLGMCSMTASSRFQEAPWGDHLNPLKVSAKSESSRSALLSIGTTVAVPFSGGLAWTSAQLLPLVTSGWETTTSGLIGFTSVLEEQLSALNVSVLASNGTFIAVFGTLSFLSCGPYDFPLNTGLLIPYFGRTYSVVLFSSPITAHRTYLAWSILDSSGLRSPNPVFVNNRAATWGLISTHRWIGLSDASPFNCCITVPSLDNRRYRQYMLGTSTRGLGYFTCKPRHRPTWCWCHWR